MQKCQYRGLRGLRLGNGEQEGGSPPEEAPPRSQTSGLPMAQALLGRPWEVRWRTS